MPPYEGISLVVQFLAALLIAFCLLSLTYVLARLITHAYYRSKLWYEKKKREGREEFPDVTEDFIESSKTTMTKKGEEHYGS